MSATVAERLEDVPMVGEVFEYGKQVWLAGLDTWSWVEKEGNHLFDALVKRGEKIEQQVRQTTEDQVGDLKQRLADGRVQLLETWQKAEEALQENIGCALRRLGVPTHSDVEDLAQRVETLNNSIEALAQVRQVALPKPAGAAGSAKAP